jgi:hypothetical protein
VARGRDVIRPFAEAFKFGRAGATKWRGKAHPAYRRQAAAGRPPLQTTKYGDGRAKGRAKARPYKLRGKAGFAKAGGPPEAGRRYEMNFNRASETLALQNAAGGRALRHRGKKR